VATVGTAGISAPGTTASVTPASAAESTESQIGIAVTSATPIVTKKSGYKVSFTLTNSSPSTLNAGTVSVNTSSRSFSSSKSLQDWADGTMSAPTPLVLGTKDVPELAKGKSTTITVDADSDQLASIRSWGAKPVSIAYNATSSTTGAPVRAHLSTYLTRSHDGLSETKTPAITIATALPLSSPERSTAKNALKELISNPAASTDVASANTTAAKELTQESELAANHSSLNVVADPGNIAFAAGLPQARLAGIMQPYAFDITARSEFSKATWGKTGIADTTWNAGTAHSMAGNDSTSTLKTANAPAIAWEGSYSWNTKSLELAKEQGYSTVVAESAESPAGSNVISGRQTVSTKVGDVTVLVAEKTLSTLAQGNPTSTTASAESSAAGRLARFTAQTALFQMQRPYVERTLLVSLGNDVNVTEASDLLSMLESADWVSQGTLKKLIADASTSNDTSSSTSTKKDMTSDVPAAQAGFTLTTTKPSKGETEAAASAISRLTSTSATINRLQNQVLKKSVVEKDDTSKENDDPQALSRQNAEKNDADKVTALQWLEKLRTVHENLGLMAFGSTQQVRTSMLAADESLSTELLDSVSAIPPSKINIFSETAQTPTTVKNALPFPISIRLQAQTDSNAITITKEKNVEVPAGSEAQATFEIRVVGTGSAIATFTPIDRGGLAFGTSPSTAIYSQLTINDMSGNVLIILALLLGAAGIYRQATRRKDPDQ
jgi:hypothetical protein